MEVKAIMDTTLGRQVSERVNGKQMQLGNAKLLEEFEVDAASIEEDAKRLRAEGRTAMGTGTDVAMESARVTLVKGGLRGIVRARLLSKATMRNIKENLFFAFVYNALGVPIAAGTLYPVFGLLLQP